jgi:polyhydroxyalkanoate synthase subunit PhaC
MTATAEKEPQIPNYADVYAELTNVAEKWKTFNRLVTTEAKIAQTPKTLIWTLNKAKLYRYMPVVPAEKRHKIPLLLVFAIMNRPHVLDLRPGHSFVEYMRDRGYDIFLLDWGAPAPEDKDLKFDDYALEYLPRVIRKLKSVSGCQQFNMLGWCLGALITTLYAALRPNDGLKDLILLTAPLDFTDKTAGGFARWAGSKEFDPDRIVDAFGNVPGELIDYGAKALKPVENFIGTYLGLWDRIDDPKVVESWHAMNTWVRDIIDMAGGAYRQLIDEFYKKNRLKEGTLVLRGERVELKNLKANVLNVIAEADHITPPCQSEGIMDLIGSQDKEVFRVRGGHIGIMAGSGAERTTWPHIDAWLSKRAD